MSLEIKDGEESQLVDDEKTSKPEEGESVWSGKNNAGLKTDKKKNKSEKERKSNEKKTPLCLNQECRQKGIKNYISD